MSHRFALACIIIFVAPMGSPSPAQNEGQSTLGPREQLRQYVVQLQKNPDDQELREKIIKLALVLKPPPLIPDKDKVLELEGEAKGALKAAKSQSDYSDAVKLFQKALLLAPRDANLNYNLAKAQEMAKQYDDAIASYKFYLLASPGAKDHDAVVEKIGELKYEAKESSPEATAERNKREAEAQAEKKHKEEADWLKSLDRTCYQFVIQGDPHVSCSNNKNFLMIRGDQLWFALRQEAFAQPCQDMVYPPQIQCRWSAHSCVNEYNYGYGRDLSVYSVSGDGTAVTIATNSDGTYRNGQPFHQRTETVYTRISDCPSVFANVP